MNCSSVSLLNLILSVTGVRFPCRVFGSTKAFSQSSHAPPSTVSARLGFGSILWWGRAQCNAPPGLCIVPDDVATDPPDSPRPGRQPRRDRCPGHADLQGA